MTELDQKNTSKILVLKKSTFFGGFFKLTQSIFKISMDLIFLDNYEENDISHDKFKKYFFELCSFFAIFTDLARPLPIGLKKKKISCEN